MKGNDISLIDVAAGRSIPEKHGRKKSFKTCNIPLRTAITRLPGGKDVFSAGPQPVGFPPGEPFVRLLRSFGTLSSISAALSLTIH